jgi:hypothetical protein
MVASSHRHLFMLYLSTLCTSSHFRLIRINAQMDKAKLRYHCYLVPGSDHTG